MRIKNLLIPALLFLFVGFVYLHNLSRSVYGGDVGDLVTAAFVRGVAHPPGYPLFTFLGFLLTRIHAFPSPAFAVGLISVVSGALGVLFFYLTCKKLTKSILISIISSSILAFSYFFWFYSEIAEVFALNSFFFCLLMYLAIRFSLEKRKDILFLFFFFIGLSLTNHLTILLTFPTFFLLILPSFLKTKEKIKTIGEGLCCILLGFSIYLYVPIASSHQPVLNWDNVRDFSSFFHLFLRKDYGTFVAGVYAPPIFLQRMVDVKVYLEQIALQLTLPVIVIAVLGCIYLFWKKRRIASSLLVGFILSGPLFIGYAGFPLTGNFFFGINERFFILSVIYVLYFFACGLFFLSRLFAKLSKVPVVFFQSIFFIIPCMLFFYNFPKTNLSTVFIGDTYAHDILSEVSKNGILFLTGDTVAFNAWYVHYVKGVRPDVSLLNIGGDIASPYYSTLENQYKKSHPHAGNLQLIQGVLSQLPSDGSVFSVEAFQIRQDTLWIPYGLVFHLINKNSVPNESAFTATENSIWSVFHMPNRPTDPSGYALGNFTIADIPNSYANAMLVTGNFYLSQYHDSQQAKKWFDKARSIAPQYEKTYSSLGVYYLTITKECNLAQSSFTKAIDLNPIGELNYFLLYATNTGCLHDTKAAEKVKNAFEKQFQTSFFQAFSQMTKQNK